MPGLGNWLKTAAQPGHHRLIARRVIILLLFGLCAAAGLRAATDELGRLREQLKAAEEAEDKPATIELARRIVALAPNDNERWDLIARSFIAQKDFDRAEATLDAWQKAAKQPPAALEDFRGQIAFSRDKFDEAEKHWLAYLAKNPSRDDAAAEYENLAGICVEQSRWVENEKYCARAIALKDSAARRVLHATALLRLRQWDAAAAEMARANKMDPTDSQVKEWLPQFELLQKSIPQIKALDGRLAKTPNDINLMLERARLLTLAGRPLLALDDCVPVQKKHPESMRARIQTAEAWLDSKQEGEAHKLHVNNMLTRGTDGHVDESVLTELTAADLAIAANPDSAEPLAGRAGTLLYLRQYSLALADAQAALALDEDSAAAHLQAAHALSELSRSREALEEMTRATDLDPKDREAWYYRGILEAQRADFDAAIKSQTQSLNIRESLLALREREKWARQTGRVKEADTDLARIKELEAGKPLR